MEAQAFSAIVAALATIIVALLTLCGILVRRNNKAGNPGHLGNAFATVAAENKGLLERLVEEVQALRGVVRSGDEKMAGKVEELGNLIRDRIPPQGG